MSFLWVYMAFSFPKPQGWDKMPLYKKIQYYGTVLGEEVAPFVDKLSAKAMVLETWGPGGELEVAKVVRILEGPLDVHPADLSPHVMIKATHGSSWNVNVTKETSVEKVQTCLSRWNRTYSSKERQYASIVPRFFIEEKIVDAVRGCDGEALSYMFRCIHGEPVTIGVRWRKVQNSYSLDWKLMGEPGIPFHVPKPTVLDNMLYIVRKLSRPFEFVRMDLHVAEGDRIFFGEYTFTPNAGNSVFSQDMERTLGKMWK
jgi:hypothetical protein